MKFKGKKRAGRSLYSGVKREQTRQEIDRHTWADLDRIAFPVGVSGSGEYLTPEPVTFGRAFEAPPFFTFSVVASDLAGTQEIRAIGWPNEHTDPTKSALQREGRVFDGSFEHQMIWDDPYIPSVVEWPNTYSTSFLAWQKIQAEQSAGSLLPGLSNHWIQTGATTGDRWVISNDRAYPNEPGYQGQYSAKYVFGSDPDSRWLIPVFPQFNPWYVEDGWTEDQVLTNVWSASHDGNGPRLGEYLSEGGYMPIAMNPPMSIETLVCHAWSDGACEVELYWRIWSGSIDAAIPPTYSAELASTSVVRVIPAGQWTECKGVFSVPFAVWPNYPTQAEDWSQTNFQLYKLRVKGGVPGQVVYLDNVWAWPDLTTRGGGLITVGVAEWVRDDRGQYVGAYLWFKTGTGSGGMGASQL